MFTALIRAGRVLEITKLTDLTAAYEPTDPFSMFLTPTSGSTVGLGDTLLVSGTTPYDAVGAAAHDLPVVVGDWSPIVFRSIAASGIDLSDVDVYVAPIKIER